MARRRNRIVHNYEPREDWWVEMSEKTRELEEKGPLLPTHGASGVGNVYPHKIKTQVTVVRIIGLIVGVLLMLLGFLIVVNDLRSDTSGGDPNPAVTTGQGLVDPKLTSPDTIARRLTKAGYQVMPLVSTYDRTGHGYDVAETRINGTTAIILAFPDEDTTRDFVNTAANTGYVVVWDKLWAISFEQALDYDVRRLAEEIAEKFLAQYYWSPEGE